MSDLYEKLLREAREERERTGLTRNQLVGSDVTYWMENTEPRPPSVHITAKWMYDPYVDKS